LLQLLAPRGPLRALSAGTFANTFGNGLWLTGSAIFFTRSVGLAPTRVGLGLSIAGVVGLFAGVPIGALADRAGPRRVAAAALCAEAACTATFAAVHAFWSFVLVAALAQCAGAGSNAARGALIAGSFSDAGRVHARAYLRSVTNLGISLGTVGAGVALHLDTRAAYLCLVFGNAATFVVAAGLLGLVPRLPGSARAPAARRWEALRDLRFLAVSGVNAVMCLSYAVLEVALPLWIITHTHAPRWAVAPLLLINTVMCVSLQVRASRGMDDPVRAALATRRAGVFFAVAFVLVAATYGHGGAVALPLLAVAMVVHTGGELLQAGGSFGLAFTLARPGAQGQYQGVWGLGFGASEAVAPALLTGLVIGWGVPGWFVLAALLLAAGAAMPVAVRWASADRSVLR
jgi:MFS family permease